MVVQMETTATFKCLQVRLDSNNKSIAELCEHKFEELNEGDVLIKSHYSSINYKDALAVLGKGKILRHFPMIPGVDVSGEVTKSRSQRWKVGDTVLVTGCGLGESHDGGFSEFVQVPESWVIPLPKSLNSQEAMILGTAGFAAALALHRLELNGLSPEKGPVLVIGASGGVGSLAIDIYSQRGYEVIAVSSRPKYHSYLKAIGAHQVLTPKELQLGSRPLEKGHWAAAVDNVGGELLAKILPHIKLWGAVASIGLAGGSDFKSTVMPFILRGVSLLGISSTNCPMPLRRELWENLGTTWKPKHLATILEEEVPLNEVIPTCHKLLTHSHRGRTIVNLR
jgi:NADPH2:quinone reductase